MRQIKFRGQRVDNKQWVYGTYHYCTGPGKMRSWDYKEGNRVFEDKAVEFNSHWILVHHTPDEKGWTERDTYTPYAVIPETVGQYTGIPERNSKDIFEHDIVKFHYFYASLGENLGVQESEHELTGIVTWGEYGWAIKAIKGQHWQGYTGYASGEGESSVVELYAINQSGLHEESFEVIGNIHSNPELLNQ